MRLATWQWTVLFLLLASSAYGQAGQARPAAYQQWQNLPGQSLNYLLMPQLVKELEIVPEQEERLREISRDAQKRLSESYQKLNDVPAEERAAKYYELMREVGEETEKQIKEVLLPMQIKRVRQIMLQMKMQQMQWGAASALVSDELAEELGISDEQRQQFQDKEKELREEIQKKTQEFYKQLQEESREKMLEVLTPEQRRKLDALAGPKFEWKYEAPMPRK